MAKASVVLAWARTKLGGRYGWTNAQGPSYGCNDYVIAAFRQAGVYIPMKQVEDLCTDSHFKVVPVDQLEPGDLLTYRFGNGTDGRGGNPRDHIGIVEDPKKKTFLQAANSRVGIQRASYASGSYARIATALRLKGLEQDVLSPKPATPSAPLKIRPLSETVKPGARAASVKDVQRMLIKNGYKIQGAITDFYGPNTQNAVAQFHEDHPGFKSPKRRGKRDASINDAGYRYLQLKAGRV